MSFGILTVGCLFLIAGVAYLAYLMALPETYVLGPVLIVLGIGIGALNVARSARRSRI